MTQGLSGPVKGRREKGRPPGPRLDLPLSDPTPQSESEANATGMNGRHYEQTRNQRDRFGTSVISVVADEQVPISLNYVQDTHCDGPRDVREVYNRVISQSIKSYSTDGR